MHKVALLAQACALLALAACGGGGGSTGSNVTPSSTQLDGDAGALQVYVGTTKADTGVNVDQITYTVFAPGQPQLTRQITGRSLFQLRGVPTTNPLEPQPVSQLVWVKQGRLYRLPAQGDLNATPVQVSGITNACSAGLIDRGGREDGWLLVMLANDQGQCGPDTSTSRQKLVALNASTSNTGVDAGLWDEVSILGMLPSASGGPGPVLTLDHNAGALYLIDPSGRGALGTSGTSPKPLKLVDDSLPLHLHIQPDVAWQQGVLQANNQLTVLDWSGSQLAWRDSAVAPMTDATANVDGAFGGDFLVSTPLQVIRLSPKSQTAGKANAQVLANYTALVNAVHVRDSDFTRVTTQSPCALVQHGAHLASNGQAALLDARVLNPSGTNVPLASVPSPTPITPQASDVVVWGTSLGNPALQSLSRFSCANGAGNPVVSDVYPLDPVYTVNASGRQVWLPFVRPPTATGFASYPFANGPAAVLTDARLGGYQPDAATEVDWGPVPLVANEQVVAVQPRLMVQHTSGALLFDLVTQDAQGTRHGALVSVQPKVANSIRLIRSGLPVPTSAATQ